MRHWAPVRTSPLTMMTSQRLLVCLQECQIQQLQLNSSEVAAQLTLRDFHLFHDVEPTEYVDELFELDSKYGHPHLDSFSRVSATPFPPPPHPPSPGPMDRKSFVIFQDISGLQGHTQENVQKIYLYCALIDLPLPSPPLDTVRGALVVYKSLPLGNLTESFVGSDEENHDRCVECKSSKQLKAEQRERSQG